MYATGAVHPGGWSTKVAEQLMFWISPGVAVLKVNLAPEPELVIVTMASKQGKGGGGCARAKGKIPTSATQLAAHKASRTTLRERDR